MGIIFVIILSYLLGSIPFGLLIGKSFYKVDIREHGSGNLGGTNAIRVLGKKPGFVVMFCDMLKGTLAVSLPLMLGISINTLIPAIFVIVGHCYPIFARFRGGKAVATTAGSLLFIIPIGCILGLISFFVTLKATKYVSLSSIVASFVIFLYSLTTNASNIVFSFVICLLIIYRHRTNLKRIKNKTESKVTWI